MSNSASPDSVQEVRNYLAAELDRFRTELSPDQWQTLFVGLSDDGDIIARPCRLVLPFHYPATIAELDELGPDHFEFPAISGNRQKIPEFGKQYDLLRELVDQEFIRAAEHFTQRRINALEEACITFESGLTIFGIESDNETWWEVNTFPLSGPRIPPPPPPVSDVQILARLCRQVHSYVGSSRFGIEDGAIVEVSFDGAETTDKLIDTLRGVPDLRELLGRLKRMSLQHTLVTDRSLKFLERELPHVEIVHSGYFRP